MPDEDAFEKVLDDGFGNTWLMCDRVNCGLQIVRPGKVQCWCDDTEDGPLTLGKQGYQEGDR